MGCKITSKNALMPSHQNILLSSIEKPMSTHHAINETTEKATVSA
jgi:hypothetical protein